MKDTEDDLRDELRPEYDLSKLVVRRVGPGRKSLGETTVRLAPDVAELFPDSDSVNAALRFLIRVTKSGQPGGQLPDRP
jgi:hypothetical protein